MTGCTAIDAARYLVYLLSDSYDDLSNMKINKLLYFAQGQALLKTGEPLFDDKIEAWKHGPIINAVYREFKAYDSSNIPADKGYDGSTISEQAKAILFDVARTYGRYTASALRSMTHKIGTPWFIVYDKRKRHIEIPQSLIASYFKKHEKVIEPIDIPEEEMEFIGYRDADGCLVLPAEWADEAI